MSSTMYTTSDQYDPLKTDFYVTYCKWMQRWDLCYVESPRMGPFCAVTVMFWFRCLLAFAGLSMSSHLPSSPYGYGYKGGLLSRNQTNVTLQLVNPLDLHSQGAANHFFVLTKLKCRQYCRWHKPFTPSRIQTIQSVYTCTIKPANCSTRVTISGISNMCVCLCVWCCTIITTYGRSAAFKKPCYCHGSSIGIVAWRGV